MRNKILFTVILVTIVTVFSVSLSPARVLAAGNTSHFRFAGKGAYAGWSTCPSYPVAPDVVCTDTFIYVAEEMFRADGTKSSGNALYLAQYSYRVDGEGYYSYISDSYGFAENVTFSINKKLTGASASAVVPITTCTLDGEYYICEEGGTATVDTSWTGQGELVKTNGKYHAVSKGYTFNSSFKGTFRDASATGQVNGNDLGTQFYAGMFSSKSGDLFVCHGGC